MKDKIFNKLTNLGSYIAVVLQHLRTKLGMPFSYSFRLIVAQYSTSFQHTDDAYCRIIFLPRCGGVSKADSIAAKAARPRSIVKGAAYISKI